MAKKCGLTEKRMSNKRFRKTEEKIFVAVFCCHDFPKVNLVVKKTKISRATLYRHHNVLCNIATDYEKYILDKYSRMIKPYLLNRNNKVKMLFYKTLIFITANKRILAVLIDKNGGIILERMVWRLRKRIVNTYRFPKDSGKIYKIYAKEVVGVIEVWKDSGFSMKKIEKVLDDIMYLTETAKGRLLPLIENKK